jgi:hypothetical protein
MRGFYLSQREELLETFKWGPEDDLKPYFFECAYSTGPADEAAGRVRHGFVGHDELRSWLEEKV